MQLSAGQSPHGHCMRARREETVHALAEITQATLAILTPLMPDSYPSWAGLTHHPQAKGSSGTMFVTICPVRLSKIFCRVKDCFWVHQALSEGQIAEEYTEEY